MNNTITNTKTHAEIELDILVKSAADGDRPIIEPFIPELLALAEKFGLSGQSGASAPMVARALSQAVEHLCLQHPIYPITGISDEWFQPLGDQSLYQNKRCSALFREWDGKAYYLDAVIWRTPTGQGYCGTAQLPDGENILSRQFVRFPFTPKTFYIDVDEHEIAPDDWQHIVKRPDDLKPVFEYYDKFTAV